MSYHKKFILLVGSAILLSGCSLLSPWTSKKQTAPVPPTPSTQSETSPTTGMESPSYKVENTTQGASTETSSTQTKNDEPEDLQKDLDAVSIESDFGALVN